MQFVEAELGRAHDFEELAVHAARGIEKQDEVERLQRETEVHDGLRRAFVENAKVVFGQSLDHGAGRVGDLSIDADERDAGAEDRVVLRACNGRENEQSEYGFHTRAKALTRAPGRIIPTRFNGSAGATSTDSRSSA